jgi:hypothetical protein
VVSQFDHMARARMFAEAIRPQVKHYRGDFLDYDGARYLLVEDDTMRADAYNWLDRCVRWVPKIKAHVPFQPAAERQPTLRLAAYHVPPQGWPFWLGCGPAAAWHHPAGFPVPTTTLVAPTRCSSRNAVEFAYISGEASAAGDSE